MRNALPALLGMLLFVGMTQVNAATLQLDFGFSFGDPNDPDTAPPDGTGPWLTAFFDDNNTPGSVALTLSVAGNVGDAEVTSVYLNVADAMINGLQITSVDESSIGPEIAIISIDKDAHKAGNDGLFDILFDLPPPGMNRFTAGETLTYNLEATGLVAGDFNYLSAPDPSELDPSGPFLGAAKFASTSGCETGPGQCSDWVGAVPVPAAVWLFGSGLLGLVGIARRKKA